MIDVRNLGSNAQLIEDQLNEYEKQGYEIITVFVVRSNESYAVVMRKEK